LRTKERFGEAIEILGESLNGKSMEGNQISVAARWESASSWSSNQVSFYIQIFLRFFQTSVIPLKPPPLSHTNNSPSPSPHHPLLTFKVIPIKSAANFRRLLLPFFVDSFGSSSPQFLVLRSQSVAH
jgi:hypothetical protein